LISNKFIELKQLNEKTELKHAFSNLDIVEGEQVEPMQIVDKRTFEILQTYEFYKNSPEKAFDPIPQVWFDIYSELSRQEPRLF